MKKTHKLTLAERNKIKIFTSLGYNKSQVARELGRHRSTVSRELNSWCSKDDFSDYDPLLAYGIFHEVNKAKRKTYCKLKSNQKLLSLVKKKLSLYWSPEQIVNWLKTQYPLNYSMNISHESIYKYIYSVPRGELRKQLTQFLRYQKKY